MQLSQEVRVRSPNNCAKNELIPNTFLATAGFMQAGKGLLRSLCHPTSPGLFPNASWKMTRIPMVPVWSDAGQHAVVSLRRLHACREALNERAYCDPLIRAASTGCVGHCLARRSDSLRTSLYPRYLGGDLQQLHQQTTMQSPQAFAMPHTLSVHNYKTPTVCKVCDKLLLGLMKQGLRCRDCKVGGRKNGHMEAAESGFVTTIDRVVGNSAQKANSQQGP